jgi:hypothetical protein
MNRDSSPGKGRVFFSSAKDLGRLWAHPVSCSKEPWVLFPVVKLPWSEVDHSLPSNVEAQNDTTITNFGVKYLLRNTSQ